MCRNLSELSRTRQDIRETENLLTVDCLFPDNIWLLYLTSMLLAKSKPYIYLEKSSKV